VDNGHDVGRHELKFLVPSGTRGEIVEAAAAMMELDPHCRGGSYLVSSVYYDTADRRFFREKVDGVPSRIKVRVRGYGASDAPLFLEIKERRGNLLFKRRANVTPEEAAAFATGDPPQADDDVKREVGSLTRALSLVPSVRVLFERTAFVAGVGSLRLTLDRNVRGDRRFEETASGEGTPVLPPGMHVVEVKTPFGVPPWLSGLFSRLGCARRSLSKYCAAVEVTGREVLPWMS
jgi:hypothetical protein